MEKADAACRVCGDKASGKHYGVPSCDGCRGFFKRSIRRGLAYHCKEAGNCVVDVTRRNQCQACRFKKCLAVNMKRDAVQHERAPRTPMAQSCSNRRHGFPFSSTGQTSQTLLDVPSYHLIYPQPTFPFPLGLKHPMAIPMGFFNCSSSTSFPPSIFSPDATSLFRLPNRSPTPNPSEVKPRVNAIAEDEVTSSEEAGQQGIYDEGKLTSSFLELPLTQGPENVYECAAKLLFLTVKWAKSIPSFLQLAFQDQALLVEESWSDLFVLSAGEWVLPINKEFLVAQLTTTSIKREILTKEVQKIQHTIARFSAMRLDHTEYSCLKALALFKPETQDLEQRTHVELVQEQAHTMLQEHCNHPDKAKTRFGKLLLLLPAVRAVSKDLLEELLFRKTIGNICIERVLSDMLRSNPGGSFHVFIFKEMCLKFGGSHFLTSKLFKLASEWMKVQNIQVPVCMMSIN